MPEVVEVCLTALFLDEKLKGATIENIVVRGGRYKRYGLDKLNTFKKKLPYAVNKVDSKGKFMWFDLGTTFLLNTFGLSGEWSFTEQAHSNIEFVIKKNGILSSLYFIDPRNFGTLVITTRKIELTNKLNSLAPDLLKTDFTDNEFYNRVEKYILDRNGEVNEVRANKEIIKVLMTQTLPLSLGSGLGNYLAVEVLYRARISPYKTMKQLYTDRQLCNRLAQSVRYETKLSFMTADVGYMEHLDIHMSGFIERLRKSVQNNEKNKYNFHKSTNLNKDKFIFKVYRQKEDSEGNKVIGDKIVAGRTTYWVPTLQR
jgi:formamidopyrimidine-DNA glycosylase